jgi:cytidine deaminase
MTTAQPPILSSASEADVTQTCSTYNLAREEFHELRKRAVEAKAAAYCPYSKFRVGAVLATKGEAPVYISGANVENASYPVTTCAERTAFVKAVTEDGGLHRRGFKAIAVATDITPPASPCGMCRQA